MLLTPILLLTLLTTSVAPPPARPMNDPNPEPETESKAIRRAGKFSLFGDKLQVEITIKKGLIGYTIQDKKTGSTLAQQLTAFKKHPDWVFVPIAVGEYWIYGGDNSFVAVKDNSMSFYTPADEEQLRAYLQTVPKEVIAELPPRMRNLLKKK
jgi:hypothetical protein